MRGGMIGDASSCTDIVPGLCGQIREGLYTSSQWIIFLERCVVVLRVRY